VVSPPASRVPWCAQKMLVTVTVLGSGPRRPARTSASNDDCVMSKPDLQCGLDRGHIENDCQFK
jgi:hypothetical protein